MLNEYINKVKKERLTREECFNFSKQVACMLCANDTQQQLARDAIIQVLDNFNNVFHREIWGDLVESAGFFPYIDEFEIRNASSLLRYAHHKSDHISKVFHSKQKELSNLILSGKNVIVSAPTSFGKSLLIEEIVASGKYKNIVIIQPTTGIVR